MAYRKHKSNIKDVISMPIIWSGIIPAMIMDVWMELYHRTCFPLYGIPYVKRSKYIRIDRHKLQYLNIFEKLGCMYCGYINGLVHYVSVIASETEKYWCAIRHANGNEFISPQHHKEFYEYGDTKATRRIEHEKMI